MLNFSTKISLGVPKKYVMLIKKKHYKYNCNVITKLQQKRL